MAKQSNPTPVAVDTCRCGCGLRTAPKRMWLPGHDARAAGVAARLAFEQGDLTGIKALPSENLQRKATDLANRWTAAAEEKAARKAERAEAAHARDLAKVAAKAEAAAPGSTGI